MWHSPVRRRRVLQVVARCVPGHTQHAPSPIVVFVCGGIRHIPYAAAYVGCVYAGQRLASFSLQSLRFDMLRMARHTRRAALSPKRLPSTANLHIPYATIHMQQQPAVLHDRTSRHPSRYACHDIHGLSVRQLTGPGIAASGKFCISSHASSEQSPALCEPILTRCRVESHKPAALDSREPLCEPILTLRHMTGPATLPPKPPSYERGLPNQPV